jgi:hypothetical protein
MPPILFVKEMAGRNASSYTQLGLKPGHRLDWAGNYSAEDDRSLATGVTSVETHPYLPAWFAIACPLANSKSRALGHSCH